MRYTEKSSESAVDRAVHWVRRVVTLKRGEGVKTEHAIEDASMELGTTTHRAKALFYRDRVSGLTVAEHDRLRLQYATYLHRKIADEERRIAALREEADALDREISDALDVADFRAFPLAAHADLPLFGSAAS